MVPLPDTLRNFVHAEAAAGGFTNDADYIQALVCAEQKRKARAKVEALIEEAFRDGESTEWTKKDLEKVKEEIRAHHAKREGISQ